MARAERLAAWMRQQVHAAAARGLVIGISGGLDSAVVARLAQLAAPQHTLGVLLPCHSDPEDERDAKRVTDTFSLATIRVDLSTVHDALVAAAKAASPASGLSPLALANLKARLRMSTLYLVANSRQYLVAGSGNRSELAIGYFTKWGDGGVDLLPLGRLLKREVRALGVELGLPQPILDRVPSAGLWSGQSDEAELGFTYAELERYLANGPQSVAPALAMRIERRIRTTEHKRGLPPVPDFD